MHPFTQRSINLARNEDYLDRLFRVYPIASPEDREIDEKMWKQIQTEFDNKNNKALISKLLSLERFPFKDSYVSFLRSYTNALKLNPNTVARLAGRCYEIGISELEMEARKPKESNTQMGQVFRAWLSKNPFGCVIATNFEEFESASENAVLNLPDKGLKEFAKERLNYNINKGLDFVAKFNGKHIVGEAKFVTAEGGNQRNQLKTTRALLDDTTIKAERIAILDGILYLKKHTNLLELVASQYNPQCVLSSLLLRDYLYSL